MPDSSAINLLDMGQFQKGTTHTTYATTTNGLSPKASALLNTLLRAWGVEVSLRLGSDVHLVLSFVDLRHVVFG